MAKVALLCMLTIAMASTETPVEDMKKRADLAIKDNEIGGEGWAQMVTRATKAFPEVFKQFFRDKFLEGEESASAKVS